MITVVQIKLIIEGLTQIKTDLLEIPNGITMITAVVTRLEIPGAIPDIIRIHV